MKEEAFFRKIKHLYSPSQKEFTLVDVPELKYMMIDGTGGPEDELFAKSIKWIFMAIHPLRQLARKKLGKNFVEPPLECLWWSDKGHNLSQIDKKNWKWRLMIVIGDWMDDELLDDALQKARENINGDISTLRYEMYHEGKSVQILCQGNMDKIQKINSQLYERYLPDHGLSPKGYHHEIYLNDVSRDFPKNMKMIIRQPIAGG